MFGKIIGIVTFLVGLFIIFVAAESRTPEGEPLAIAWLISIMGLLALQAGIVMFFSSEKD